MDLNQLTGAHIKVRDARAALKREFEASDGELKAAQEKIEAKMLAFLNDSGTTSAKTDSGTFYKQEDLIPAGADWNAFYGWIVENDAFDALERRIKKTFIKEYIESHDGEVPPGVSVFREYVIRVRRGN